MAIEQIETANNRPCPEMVNLWPKDYLGRATGVNAIIGQLSIREPGNHEGFYPDPRFAAQLPRPPHDWQQSHLLASKLGGPGRNHYENRVMLRQTWNYPIMAQVEKQVTQAARAGDCVSYMAIPTYSGTNLYPDFVTITAVGRQVSFIVVLGNAF